MWVSQHAAEDGCACRARLGPSFHRESGSALLIVLAFIVILAIVLTAFLSSSKRALQQSESSSAILKTELLGEVATAAIVEDLKAEMRAGADSVPADGEAMKVSHPWAMVPGRVVKDSTTLTDANFVNLVKQSVSGQAFFPGNSTATYSGTGRKRASGASTAVPSRNERVISPERWDKPRLVGGPAGLATFSSARVPDWILITRAGAMEDGATVGSVADKAPSNSGYVLGRFAYNIYKVDGLLDINVAGFDPTDSGAAATAASKGTLAWADLRAIPGLANDNTVRDLVQWRNKVSRTDYPAMIAGLTPVSSGTSLPNRWGEPGGFLEPYAYLSKTDNRFFSRQDLLNYFKHQFGAASDAALPYLTTFSADLNQPSFRPDPNRPKVERDAGAGGNDAYGDESKTESEQINPPLLAVTGTDGNPVVKRRFPLDRLKYVYPNPGEPAKVAEYFGLTWDPAAKVWKYVDDDSIKRLHEIDGREPNMIELLKAAIATGSLGGQFSIEEKLGSPRTIGGRDASINYQVMRIAASVIDQYDSDSYPTRIQFGSYTVSGVENLPYLYGMRLAAYRQTVLDPANAVKVTDPPYPSAETTEPLYRSVIMIQPIIWNPHALQSSSGTGSPIAFRVTANSGLDIRPKARRVWWITSTNYWSNWPSKTGDPRDADTKIAFSAEQDYIRFQVSPSDTSKASFREPYTLKAPNYPPGSNAAAYNGGVEFSEATLGPTEQNDEEQGDELDNRTIGFRAGWVWSGPRVAIPSTPVPLYLQEGQLTTNGVDVELQYQAPDGQWVTYDAIEKFNAAYNYRQGRVNSGTENPVAMRFHMRADPRVDRYGLRSALFLSNPGPGNNAFYRQGQSMRPASDGGLYTTSGWDDDLIQTPAAALSTFNFHVPVSTTDRLLGLLSENKESGLWYEDPDGIARLAMGGFSSGTDGLPMALAAGDYKNRPVVLNRPFRSVAELGNVLRDQPWKQLDFFSPKSGDAALLDMFCLYESADGGAEPVVGGRVNLNTPRAEVAEALLRSVGLLDGGTTLSDAQAKALGKALVDWTSSNDNAKGPLRNRSELVGKFVSGSTYSGFSSTLSDVLSGADKAIALRRQNVLRALVDPTTTRAWTFLIDLIVQDGRFVGTGTGPGDFTVRGEKRFWVHVSMDRFTGEVISERVEEVYE